MAMVLAPAEPIGRRSPPRAARTISVSAGGRVRLTTSTGARSTGGGSAGGETVDSVRHRAGRATAAAVGNPFSTRATWTDQSKRGACQTYWTPLIRSKITL